MMCLSNARTADLLFIFNVKMQCVVSCVKRMSEQLAELIQVVYDVVEGSPPWRDGRTVRSPGKSLASARRDGKTSRFREKSLATPRQDGKTSRFREKSLATPRQD